MVVLENDSEAKAIATVLILPCVFNDDCELEMRDIPVHVHGNIDCAFPYAHFTGNKLIVISVFAGDDETARHGR